jgi:hypothetical protein
MRGRHPVDGAGVERVLLLSLLVLRETPNRILTALRGLRFLSPTPGVDLAFRSTHRSPELSPSAVKKPLIPDRSGPLRLVRGLRGLLPVARNTRVAETDDRSGAPPA